MGIDNSAATFLTYSKRRGANFSRTITFGRQSLEASEKTVQRIWEALALPQDQFPKLRKGLFAEPFFEALGATTIDSLDASDFEGASVIHDLNLPVAEALKRKYSVVIDSGTIEHIFNAPIAFKNAMELLEVGGHFIQINCANNFMGHGFWQFSPELIYRMFSPANGYQVRVMLLHEINPDGKWYTVEDPAVVGRRVTMLNARETYILTLAQRMADVPIFASSPVQSDYAENWADRPVQKVRRRKGPAARMRRWLRHWRLENNHRYDNNAYREIPERALVEG